MISPDADPVLMLLVGEWRGKGVADFPTIERTEYVETLRVEWDTERRVLVYERLAVLSDGKPSQRELGFIRRADNGELEMWNSQDNGRSEALRGSASSRKDGTARLEFRSAGFLNDPRMVQSERVFDLNGADLQYRMAMETTTAPGRGSQIHLVAELERRQ